MDERCFRPLLCTVKAELGRGQPGLMRWIWDETLPQSSIDRSTFYSAAHRATKWASGRPQNHWKSKSVYENKTDASNLIPYLNTWWFLEMLEECGLSTPYVSLHTNGELLFILTREGDGIVWITGWKTKEWSNQSTSSTAYHITCLN